MSGMKYRHIFGRQALAGIALAVLSASPAFAGGSPADVSYGLEAIGPPEAPLCPGGSLVGNPLTGDFFAGAFFTTNSAGEADGLDRPGGIPAFGLPAADGRASRRRELEDLGREIRERGECVGEDLRRARRHLDDLRGQVDSVAGSIEWNPPSFRSGLRDLGMELDDARRKVRATFASARAELDELESKINGAGAPGETRLPFVRRELEDLRSEISSADFSVRRNLDDWGWKVDALESPCRSSIRSRRDELGEVSEGLWRLGSEIRATGWRSESGFGYIGRAVDDAAAEIPAPGVLPGNDSWSGAGQGFDF